MSALFRSSASAHTFTTWRNWHEWNECRQHVDASFDHSFGVQPVPSSDAAAAASSNRTEHGLRAIQIVNAWRARGRLPLAVESTAQLIQLNIKYQFPANTYVASSHHSTLSNSASSSSSDSTLQARLQYSMALLRLVNGILDPMQAKQYAQSVSSLARQMHLPRILVDIRHESTHQSLPSLPLLQLASISALQWLFKHYWSAQSHALTRLDETIKHRLRDYKKHKSAADAKRKAAREAAAAAEGDDDEEAAGNEDDTETKAKQDQHADVASGDQILFSVDPSVQSSSSVPEKALDALKELFSAMSSGNTVQHTHQLVETKLLPLLLSDVALIKPPKQARVGLTSVFRKLVDTWEPALNFLSYKWRSQNLHLTQHLFKAIVQQLAVTSNVNIARESETTIAPEKNEQIWRKDLLREWGLHLLKTQATTLFRVETAASISASASVVAALSDKETNKKRSHGTMQDASAAPPMSALDEVLYTCMKSLNPYLAAFLPLLVPIFKQAAQSRKDVNTKAITKIELLLHVVTKSLYPQHRIATPAHVQLTIPQLNDNLVQKAQEFIGKRNSTIVANSSSQAPTLSSSNNPSAPRKFFRVKRSAPSFLPLGMLEQGADDSLWLQDETWTVRTSSAAAVALAPAVSPMPTEEAGNAMEVDNSSYSDEKEEKRSVLEASPAKRSKVEATPTSKLDKTQLAQQKAAQQDAIKQLQQAIVWL